MDAVRISDGRKVFLKRVKSRDSEIAIHRYLSQPDRLKSSRNHTAPLLDVFADDGDPRFSYMVLPLLQNYFQPDFFFVDEVVDFARQLLQVSFYSLWDVALEPIYLQGIHYMHEAGVAHR